MDSRDYLDADGWPVIPDRDRLPLVALIEGAALTGRYNQQIKACGYKKAGLKRAFEIEQSREAVAYELTLPAWWHCCPVRKIVCSHSKPKWDRP